MFQCYGHFNIYMYICLCACICVCVCMCVVYMHYVYTCMCMCMCVFMYIIMFVLNHVIDLDITVAMPCYIMLCVNMQFMYVAVPCKWFVWNKKKKKSKKKKKKLYFTKWRDSLSVTKKLFCFKIPYDTYSRPPMSR